MHDPMTVAFEIKRPWPKGRLYSKGRGPFYWPPLVTVWHIDPERGGDDNSCDWHGRQRRQDRRFLWWIHPRWHVWHWRLQIHFLQDLKRWLWSRCATCRGRFRWGYAPVSTSWHGDGPRWFKGERHVYHHTCVPLPTLTPPPGTGDTKARELRDG